MADYKRNPNGLFCSFCGKDQTLVKKLIAGPAVYICDEGVRLCADLLGEKKYNPQKIPIDTSGFECGTFDIFLQTRKNTCIGL